MDFTGGNTFFGVIIRGLDPQSNINDLKNNMEVLLGRMGFQFEEVLDVAGVGCTIIYLKNLMDCIKVCKAINNKSLGTSSEVKVFKYSIYVNNNYYRLISIL